MALASGSRVGPYEILAPLGAGGMGEVYRAKDTRLDRVVAIKVLPTHLSANPKLRERFEREARAVSSLNHPNICTLHDIGHQNGIDFLVLEYIEGETLAERLSKGPMPLEQALRYAQQIAGALEKAHRHGIVHRDLKPGNIMITRTGAKLLDFGLAKAFAPSPQSLASSVSILQTEEAKNLTAEGTIIGTFQYMSPEQLEGSEVDARSDIFSLGTVIYEMVTGKKPFMGKSPASLIAAILATEPPSVTSINTMAPPVLDYVVRKCLAKDPADRWQSTQDLASQIQWILDQRSSPSAAAITPVVEQTPRKFSIAWILAAIFFGLSIFLLTDRFLHQANTSPVTKMSIITPEDPAEAGNPALSPDGRTLAFRSSSSDGTSLLWLRRFDATEPQLVRGTEGATFPFWSPDGRWLGFFAGGNLKKIEIASGQIQTLCNAGDTALVRGGTWSSNGAILFASAALGVEGLYRVPATGGERTLATRLDPSTQEATHRWPHFLPDGRHFLYNIRGGKPENSGIYVGNLDSNDKKRILPDLFRAEYASDSLFFIRNRTLMVQPFDAKHFVLNGKPLPLIENVDSSTTGYASFSVQGKEVLVYRSRLLPPKTQLTWFDEHGESVSTIGPPGFYRSMRLSPDGNRLAVALMDQSKGSEDLWTVDLARSTFYRLTSDPGSEFSPVWSPDGTQIIFGSDRDVAFNVYQKPASGSGKEELVIEPVSKWIAWPFVEDWSRDGRYILYGRETDLWVLPLFGQRKGVSYLESQFNKTQARFSPDGRYIAFTSDESGTWEIYVRPFPQVSAGKWQISSGGGSQPQFRADGKEMFYLSPDKKLMRVEIRLEPSFEFGTPTALFQASVELEDPDVGGIGVQHGNCYVPSLDGKRFLVNRIVKEAEPSPFSVVFNWPAAIQQ